MAQTLELEAPRTAVPGGRAVAARGVARAAVRHAVARRFTAAQAADAPAERPGEGSGSASDEELILLCGATDDRAAFEELVHRYEGKLFGYLKRYLGDAEAAEDVCQTTFLQVHLCRQTFTSGRRFRPWLYAIATNQAIDAHRRSRRHRMTSLDEAAGRRGDADALVTVLAADGPMAEDEAADRESAAWLHSAIERLPQAMKVVLALVYGEQLKYREAAHRLRIPVGTVKSRVHAALNRLHRHLDN